MIYFPKEVREGDQTYIRRKKATKKIEGVEGRRIGNTWLDPDM